jgi:hypothetical protein
MVADQQDADETQQPGTHKHTDDEPLDPTDIAQFVEHDRCPRYLKQRVDPGDEATSREWREAFGLMNVALLGYGQEFEARQVEALAEHATKIIGPNLDTQSKTGVPDIPVDETWAASTTERTNQLRTAIEDAKTLSTNTDDIPYILCYQAPLSGSLGDEELWGEVDCLVLAPAAAVPDDKATHPQTTQLDPDTLDVVTRVIDIKSASEQQPAHRIQVAIYSALLKQTLAEEPATCRIETSVLTQETAATPGDSLQPFDLPTFRRAEWELFAERLLAEDGPIDDILDDDLDALPFTLNQVCNNCAYREACATRAVEDPTEPSSLALLGLDAHVQQTLHDHDITNLRELSTLLERPSNPRPTDDPPELGLDPDTRRALEEALPDSIHETVQRAQALRGELDPDYPSYTHPPGIPGTGWVPLPDDRRQGWSNIDDAQPGTLIHLALFVRPDSTIDRVGALGACITADAHDEYHTVGEVIDAVPDDPTCADDVERTLFDRFLTQVFDTIETVAAAVGNPTDAVIHCYTYTAHEKDALAEGLDRHADTLDRAAALRTLLSLHLDGHTDIDQDMISAVQPILNEHFALQYPSQGLLAVTEQFIPNWTLEAFDPLDARADEPPLRAIFDEQFLGERVPYLAAAPGIRLHLAPGPLAESPAADAADTDADSPAPDGWYPIRQRAGGQFPLEYLWAVTPKEPGDDTPRLTPAIVDEWNVDEEDKPHYRQEISRFYYRTGHKDEPLQRADVEYLVERLSYTLTRLVDAVPDKDMYHPKAPLDVTRLADIDLPVTSLPAAARDYLRMEHGAHRKATLAHYRQSLRQRARTGRSIPIRCTDVDRQDDGTLTITGELAYGALFTDHGTATQVAQQARIRSGDGPGGGSWRVLTRLTAPTPSARATATRSTPDDTPSPQDYTEAGVEDSASLQHSPPVLVTNLDKQTGTITCTAFPHRFQATGSEFRVDHCGWHAPVGSNVDDPDTPPADRPGYVADRQPVWVETGELFMLDSMLDDFGAPKADEALKPGTIDHNTLWHHLTALRATGQHPPALVCPSGALDEFVETMTTIDDCLDPTADQAAVITATDQALLPVQGPPGTGKTSGATAPALLARARACAQGDTSFVGVVVAPSHEAVDAVLDSVVDLLGTWRTATGELSDLEVVRVLPSSPQHLATRADDGVPNVDVTYCNYNAEGGQETLARLATQLYGHHQHNPESPNTQCLVFATPSTLYQTLKYLARATDAIDGDSAPAAMRHDARLADIVCLDEASMLDVPRLLLAGSVLKPTGQTLLVGDHRQLATVTQVDWQETLRKPLEDTQAYRSALDYVRWLNTTTPTSGQSTTAPGGGTTADTTDTHQTSLATFDTGPGPVTDTGGDDDGA